MPMFKMVTDMAPRGDQPKAIEELVESLEAGNRWTTLLGVTGSGKTYSAARAIERLQRAPYTAKDASINDETDRLRHAATKALMERRDVIVVASVSCIYGLGRPEGYKEVMLLIRKGERRSREESPRRLVDIQYERNDIDFTRGRFRVRGDVIEIHPAYEERAVRVELFGNEVDRIMEVDALTGEVLEEKPVVAVWPARHWGTTEERLGRGRRGREGGVR